MASPPPPQQPTPGSSFYPQNHVTQYLLPKLAGTPLPAATQHFFVDADVYADDPGTLTLLHQPGPARTFGESENWYYFCTEKPTIARDGRKPRIVGGGNGTWKSEKGEMVLDPVEGRAIGRLERFTYKPKPKVAGKKPEWLMVEFSLDEQEVDGGGEPRIVLCKIYRSPRFMNSASKASSSASACKSKASARKRKAASLSASGQRKNLKTTGDSSAVRRQLLFPHPPALNPLTHEAVLGENCDSVTQQSQSPSLPLNHEAVLGENSDPLRQQLRSPSPPPPIPLGDVPFLGDEQFWSEYYRIGELPDLAPNRYPPAPNSPVKGAFLGENSESMMQQLQVPPPPPPNSPGKEDFFGDNSNSMMQQLQVPPPPPPNSPGKEDFFGDNSNSMMQQLQVPPPPPPISPGKEDFFGDNSNSMMHLLRPPSPPAPTSPIKDFFGDNSNSMMDLLRFPSPPAPNLTADVDEWMVQFLADNTAPWPCSMTAAPVPFCSGMDFCNSIIAP